MPRSAIDHKLTARSSSQSMIAPSPHSTFRVYGLSCTISTNATSVNSAEKAASNVEHPSPSSSHSSGWAARISASHLTIDPPNAQPTIKLRMTLAFSRFGEPCDANAFLMRLQTEPGILRSRSATWPALLEHATSQNATAKMGCSSTTCRVVRPHAAANIDGCRPDKVGNGGQLILEGIQEQAPQGPAPRGPREDVSEAVSGAAAGAMSLDSLRIPTARHAELRLALSFLVGHYGFQLYLQYIQLVVFPRTPSPARVVAY